MSSSYSFPGYRSRYFDNKILTKTLGEPNIDSIAKLHREVKRIAQKVPTALSEGQNGFLGLVIPPNIYNTIPGTRLFVRPEDPGLFIPTRRRLARFFTRGTVIQRVPRTHTRTNHFTKIST